MVGISGFGDQDSLDDGGTIWFDEDARSRCSNAGHLRLLHGAGAHRARAHDGGERISSSGCPPSVELVSRAEFIEDQTAFAAAFVTVLRPVLQGFAYLSMFVCAFVIFNTFSVVVTQRFRELALIRAVGGTPAQVRRSLMVEGLAIGVVASALGIVGGIGLTLVRAGGAGPLRPGAAQRHAAGHAAARSCSACSSARS